METESSSKHTGAEGGQHLGASHALAAHSFGCSCPLTSASFSDRRRGAAEGTTEAQTQDTPLSWAGSHTTLGKNVLLFYF